jgi:hypothetical protein
MISPDQPGPIQDQKKSPPRDKQDGEKKECDCGHDHKAPEEEGVESANDFMRKFLKKSDDA